MEISFMFLLAVTLSCPVQTSVKTCRPDQYSCGDTQCVSLMLKCDGVKDCLNGADEEGCSNKTCQPNKEFSCGDKRQSCVPMIWRCDGDSDCLNGADEEGCVVKTCKPGYFSCGDEINLCLPMRWRCDRDKDCNNGADEKDCVTQGEDAAVTSQNQTAQSEDDLGSMQMTPVASGSETETWKDPPSNITITSQNQTAQSEDKTCKPEQFSCGDKHQSCVPVRWRCDGDSDCLNGADEEGCNKTCQPEQFSCGDKRQSCVAMRWRCDGDSDCLNGADEEGCNKTCKPKQFSCGDKRQTCVPMRWRCDGDSDCLNGADEEGCVTQGEDAAVTSQNSIK